MANTADFRTRAIFEATDRKVRVIDRPKDSAGKHLKVSEYYGENLFDFRTADGIPEAVRKELLEVSRTGKALNREHVEIVATAATEWATSKGATHFCHWFQPLTGATAEKHDAFLDIKNSKPIERISISQLMQGEPDASSFPHGGTRTTFEARGYTAWDITSPMFLLESSNGKTLCIPTAFVSYLGHALDIKTPLLRSVSALSNAATKFLNLCGSKETTDVNVTCGCEQEYFLIDKAFHHTRTDLTMTHRALVGSLSAKNQQLSDHYFGDIPTRVMAFMQELDHELYKLGIPAKTRHNEVAPSQFEIAPIFADANVASDQNQLMMSTIKRVAHRHDFVALLHEKPFADINGSGKHLNWSMGDNTGLNLLEPGDDPHQNSRFLATVAIVCEAVHRRARSLRMAIASHGNDHRLGGHEAPPSIISVFLGDTIDKIFSALMEGKTFEANSDRFLDIGTQQLAQLLKDNTDRNRTSPFAFTGNKFEFRAVGSSQPVGFPMTFLNAAVAEVFNESNAIIEKDIADGKSIDAALTDLTKKWLTNCKNVIFNGDGYSEDWVKEAEKRGLPNLKNSAEALPVLLDEKEMTYLIENKILTKDELTMRYNVKIESYVLNREIEYKTLSGLVHQHILPAAISYKGELAEGIKKQKEIGVDASTDTEICKRIQFAVDKIYSSVNSLDSQLKNLPEDLQKAAELCAGDLLKLTEDIANVSNELEEIIPDMRWTLPKYNEMLFLR